MRLFNQSLLLKQKTWYESDCGIYFLIPVHAERCQILMRRYGFDEE